MDWCLIRPCPEDERKGRKSHLWKHVEAQWDSGLLGDDDLQVIREMEVIRL